MIPKLNLVYDKISLLKKDKYILIFKKTKGKIIPLFFTSFFMSDEI